MKFVHISDLHLGKKIKEFSLQEDQEFILLQILKIVENTKADALVIAGDIYDKSIPPVEAINAFDSFLTKCSKKNIPVYIIYGNHDSAERVTFGNKLMEKSGIYFSSSYSGKEEPFIFKDDFGEVTFYLLPFIKPSSVRNAFEEEAEKISSYNEAVAFAVKKMNVDKSKRNVLVAHQFVTGAVQCDSEEINVGGLDNVDVNVFEDFDYVALGHIHGPQNVSKKNIRYCGSPLKYSFSECSHKKSVTLVEMKEKGDMEIQTIPLIPKRDMREIKGSYEEITLKKNYENTNTDDFLHITLTDEEDINEAFGKLRIIFPHLVSLDYDNIRTRTNNVISSENEVENKSPLELFEQFYELQNNQKFNADQKSYCKNLIEKIWEN